MSSYRPRIASKIDRNKEGSHLSRQNDHPQSTAICVLGMHRSGTSAITRAIGLLGAYLGEDSELLAPGEANPEGFWEHAEIVGIQQRILQSFGLDWDTKVPLPDRWWEFPESVPLVEQLKVLIGARFRSVRLWAWKDPRTCLLLPMWKAIMSELNIELKFVLTVRNPLDIARSLARRNGFSASHCLAVWQLHTLSAITETEGYERIIVSYDQFLDNPERELQRITTGLNADWPESIASSPRVGDFLNRELRHSVTDTEQLERNAPKPVAALYRLCLEACSDESSVQPGAFAAEIEALRHEFESYARLLAPSSEPRANPGIQFVQLFWSESESFSEQHSRRLQAAPNGARHTYSVLIPDRCGMLRLDPVNFPALTYIYSIRLLDRSGGGLLTYEAPFDDTLHVKNGYRCPDATALRIAAFTSDPQIVFPFSSSGGCTLVLDMKIAEQLDETWFHSIQAQIDDQQQQLASKIAEQQQTIMRTNPLHRSLIQLRSRSLSPAGRWMERLQRAFRGPK